MNEPQEAGPAQRFDGTREPRLLSVLEAQKSTSNSGGQTTRPREDCQTDGRPWSPEEGRRCPDFQLGSQNPKTAVFADFEASGSRSQTHTQVSSLQAPIPLPPSRKNNKNDYSEFYPQFGAEAWKWFNQHESEPRPALEDTNEGQQQQNWSLLEAADYPLHHQINKNNNINIHMNNNNFRGIGRGYPPEIYKTYHQEKNINHKNNYQRQRQMERGGYCGRIWAGFDYRDIPRFNRNMSDEKMMRMTWRDGVQSRERCETREYYYDYDYGYEGSSEYYESSDSDLTSSGAYMISKRSQEPKMLPEDQLIDHFGLDDVLNGIVRFVPFQNQKEARSPTNLYYLSEEASSGRYGSSGQEEEFYSHQRHPVHFPMLPLQDSSPRRPIKERLGINDPRGRTPAQRRSTVVFNVLRLPLRPYDRL